MSPFSIVLMLCHVHIEPSSLGGPCALPTNHAKKWLDSHTVWGRMCINILIQLEEYFTILHCQEFTNNCFPTILLLDTKCRHKFFMCHYYSLMSLQRFRLALSSSNFLAKSETLHFETIKGLIHPHKLVFSLFTY